MGYANKEGVYWSSISLAANKDGDPIDLRNNRCGAIEVVWTAADAADGVLKLQESVSGNAGSWFDIASQTVTISVGAGSKLFKLTQDILLANYVRAVLAKGANTTGSVTVQHTFKGDR